MTGAGIASSLAGSTTTGRSLPANSFAEYGDLSNAMVLWVRIRSTHALDQQGGVLPVGSHWVAAVGTVPTAFPSWHPPCPRPRDRSRQRATSRAAELLIHRTLSAQSI